MRPSTQIAPLRRGSRALSGLLLLVLVLTPACSLICQAQICQTSPTTRQDAGCHHEGMRAARQDAALIAAVSACGVQEVVFALPTPINKWQANETSDARLSPLFLSTNSSTLALARCWKTDRNPVGEFHRSIASPFSFDSFVFLRV